MPPNTEDDEKPAATVEEDIGKSRDASKTDDEAVAREEEAIKIDGLNVAQMKELREKGEKSEFQAEVSRMMKLIINSLYRNKEIFLRELISNSSDALDKIRFMSLTDKEVLGNNPELEIKIKVDKENRVLHITDTGIGMTKQDLIKNLGTIAKSGTNEFFKKMQESGEESKQASDLIGQFGVGFYSAFLVADRVVVTSKHNDDIQHIWQSDSIQFSVAEDPRGNTLGRGTTVSLYLKEEAQEYLEQETLKTIIKKYSQFINFNIYLWASKVETVEEPIEDEDAKKDEKKDEEAKEEKKDEEVEVEEEKEEKKPKTRKVDKTVWDWELMNGNKPIWTRSPKDVEETDYDEFYKQFSKDTESPLTKTHFVAEGEVTFRSILFVPQKAPYNFYQEFGKHLDNIKLYVRRVFITDDFQDMMPRYLSFIRGVVDSDDLPLNVSRETLQQHKLLKVIKKKLVRKSLPEFEGKKFQNVAKEGLKIGEDTDKKKDRQKSLETKFKPLTDWLKDKGLKDLIEKVAISQRLSESPCALVASSFAWSGNMERIMKAQAYAKQDDANTKFFTKQKKHLEINPYHPLIKELLNRVENSPDDHTAKDIARVMFDTAMLRSGFALDQTSDFASRIERMLRLSANIDPEAKVEHEDDLDEEEQPAEAPKEEEVDDNEEDTKEKDEL
ncbi:uncharacterized protein TRIADDRAFT_64388 [Trichoplax adhaerens]|uniref:Histidine kinase/HSP90-like ATPase domain-containing protein n=1 Tax=Trichoplax adhaerens TaxID=10228 RepID=B3SC78_TRIAD|nr:hypothetical protein TRIADDRAFT_64388 [Trichoplax adhaerens]EDV19690.1 hypothetical protein TRIADDRAFT_64388 [Trichoplax adhaerens]|eukprot:XP_002117847.1 hypothetical protein TRIADDRAFT_64388 [Trichoplax adhaerens]